MATAPDPITVVLRSEELLEGRVWVCGCPDAAAASRLAAVDAELHYFSLDLRAHELLKAGGFPSVYGPWPEPVQPFDAALLFLPKGRGRLELLLAMAREVLRPAGRLLVTGAKKEGIKSTPAILERSFTEVERVDSARHCSLLAARSPGPLGAGLAERRSSWRLPEALGGLEIVSYPGVFHHGGLDEGTALLLETLAAPRHARILAGCERILDLGSGSGVLGAWLAANTSAQVDLVDTDALAVLASGQTLEANGLDKGVVQAADVWGALEGRYDLIVSNPPFHRGYGTDYSVAEALIAGAPERLVTKGHLVIVANGFLPYPSRIEEALGGCTTWAETPRFRVWTARMTRRARQQHRSRKRAEEQGLSWSADPERPGRRKR